MVTLDGPLFTVSGRDGRPLWKRHWDAVLAIAAEELALTKGAGATPFKWPENQPFLDIRVTTPKSRGVYRVFRTYPDGTVSLGTVTQKGLVKLIQPNAIELTPTHLEEFRRVLREQLDAMRQ